MGSNRLPADTWWLLDPLQPHIRTARSPSFAAGQHVELEWEAPGQDGYHFRTVHVWAIGHEPVDAPAPCSGPSAAYTSAVALTQLAADDQVLTIDGQQFQVHRRPGIRPVYDYTLLSGSRQDYGFS